MQNLQRVLFLVWSECNNLSHSSAILFLVETEYIKEFVPILWLYFKNKDFFLPYDYFESSFSSLDIYLIATFWQIPYPLIIWIIVSLEIEMTCIMTFKHDK